MTSVFVATHCMSCHTLCHPVFCATCSELVLWVFFLREHASYYLVMLVMLHRLRRISSNIVVRLALWDNGKLEDTNKCLKKCQGWAPCCCACVCKGDIDMGLRRTCWPAIWQLCKDDAHRQVSSRTTSWTGRHPFPNRLGIEVNSHICIQHT